MGIPRLVHSLEPYAVKSVLNRKSQDTAEQESATNAIIDGPSLAYHVYYVCLAQRSGARNAIEAAPSYEELGQAAVWWSEQIEQYGSKIRAIHFDGFSPASKKDVRLSRLQNYTNQLVQFRASHKDDLPPRLREVNLKPADSSSPAYSSTKLKASPAPTFLVPAIIEALQSSSYASLTTVMPGEADSYCANTARTIGGTIFTSDSDLLAHDLGAQGRVVLFRDIESAHIASKGVILKVSEYHPQGIANRLGSPNLTQSAFHIEQDPYRSFTDCVELAKKGVTDEAAFARFTESYTLLPQHSRLVTSRTTDIVRDLLSRCDPRTSESIHHVSADGKIASVAKLEMYLPVSIEDPTRTSAWRAGEGIRMLAYSTLQSINPTVAQVGEFERKGTRPAETDIMLFEESELTGTAHALVSMIHGLHSMTEVSSHRAKWRALAVQYVCEANAEHEKPIPSKGELVHLMTGAYTGSISWSYLHASAQCQAVLYSSRISKQILGIFFAFIPSEAVRRNETLQTSETLSISVQDLLTIPQLFDDTIDISEMEREACTALVVEIRKSYGIEDRPDDADKKSKKKKKKKAAAEGQGDVANDPAWQKNNMYSSLV